MDVSCPACAARYKADEQKLRGKTARMRCRACDTVWLVSGPAAEIVTTESKRAAVVKRGAEREHRDLFATRPPDLGSVKQTLRPPPPDSQLSGMAARNETSVLFTVDALRGNARLNTPDPEPSPVSRGFALEDDEGIIDLNA
ncbi:MAG TPA: zinc-ribbon domain-containing protein, partial [Labilithrix sp.]|nr:zinc-ribbon domain-containing protein [Labilithrix sp.]